MGIRNLFCYILHRKGWQKGEEKHTLKDTALRWIPVLLWMGLIFYSSSQSHLPGPQNHVLDFTMKKIAHVIVYAVLALLLLQANRVSKRPAIYAMVIAVLYAASDEFHQSFVPGREPTLRDVGIDAAASAAALILAARNAQVKKFLMRL